MPSQESNVEISQFTNSDEPGTAPDASPTDDTLWADRALEDNFDMVVVPTPNILQIEVPEVLAKLKKKGVEFREVHFWGLKEDHSPKLVRNQSLYFSVDTIITSQLIIEAFDKAGIDVGEITCIQRQASNRSWVVTFDSPLTKEAALEVASVEIDGHTAFLGNCEHRLMLVEVYEAPVELPDTAVIGRLSHYGRVLSFRRDKLADTIDNGVRTASMELHQAIPSTINLAGEFLRIWYPHQPKMCRNCGAKDHMVKDCESVRCINCEMPGHRHEDCSEPPLCGVCKSHEHQMADCPFVFFSANIAASSRLAPQLSEEQRETRKAEREKQKKLEKQNQQQQQAQAAKKGEKTKTQDNNARDDKQSSEARGCHTEDRERDAEPRDGQARDERPPDGRLRDDDGKQRHDEGKQRRDEDGKQREDRSREDDDRRRRRDEERRRDDERREDQRRRDRERDDRYRDYYSRGHGRDRSSRRDRRNSDDDDDDGRSRWTYVSY